ncbi:MAG: S26 family signal peptidase [Candidatus Omnitrophota bacterium]|jgi:signal peptidase I
MTEHDFSLCSLTLFSEALQKNQGSWARVTGKSMVPVLKENDLVSISPCLLSQLHYGDIVVFKRQNSLISHRVIKKARRNGELLVMAKADTGFSLETFIGSKELLGKVTLVKKDKGVVCLDTWNARIFGLCLAFFLPCIARLRYLLKKF